MAQMKQTQLKQMWQAVRYGSWNLGLTEVGGIFSINSLIFIKILRVLLVRVGFQIITIFQSNSSIKLSYAKIHLDIETFNIIFPTSFFFAA